MGANNSSTSELQFGELVIRFTDQFYSTWDDRGIGANLDGAYFIPNVPEGFHALGGLGKVGFDNPNNRFAVMCVKEAAGNTGKPALARPESFDLLWKDSGSGANRDGSCWRPVPPPGYEALRDIFWEGYYPPSVELIRCVKTELTVTGNVGNLVWNDKSSGANDDFSSWQIVGSGPIPNSDDASLAVNTFVGVNGGYDKPSRLTAVVKNLRLPLPSVHGPSPPKPTLMSRLAPSNSTSVTLNRIVTIPFTAVTDNSKSLEWKVNNSPFYTIEKNVFYSREHHADNHSTVAQQLSKTIVTGVTESQTETFSESTGITVSVEVGVKNKFLSATVGFSLTKTFGYETSSSTSQLRQTRDTISLSIPGNTAAAVWMGQNQIIVRRADGSVVSENLGFAPSSTATITDQYPKQSSVSPTAPIILHSTFEYAMHNANVHSDSSIWIDIAQRDQLSRLRIVPGLRGVGVSFESVDKPHHYLRHSAFVLWLHKNDNSDLFHLEATFHPMRGLADSEAVSFESMKFPNHFIRHQGSRVKISERINEASFARDATWTIQSP